MSAPTELARRIDPVEYGLPAVPATNAEAIARAFAVAKARGCNLVGAETTISYVPPGYSVVFRLVRFDPAAPKTWYRTDDGFALSFVALSQLAALAGITWEESEPVPVPPRERNLWRHKARASMRLIDGTRRSLVATAELDLRDGSAAHEAAQQSRQGRDGGTRNGMAALLKKREKGAAHCASSAQARVIRQLLGIRTYSPEEQAKPFVVVTLAWIPPVGNPEVDKMIAAAELGVVSQVYGARPVAPAPKALPAPTEILEEEPDEAADDEAEFAPVEREERRETEREPERAPEPWDAPAEREEHHSSWAADQRRFFAALKSLGDEWGVSIPYDEVKDWCAELGKPKPSAMDQAGREAMVGFLRTAKGRNSLESWIHTGELPGK